MNIKIILSNIIYIFFIFIYKQKRITLLESSSSQSFGNIISIAQELKKLKIKYTLISYKYRTTNYIRYIKYLAQSKVIVIDSNSPASFLKISSNTVLINCWHAGGAYKCIGLDALRKNKSRDYELKRVKRVHSHIDYFICSSPYVAKIYAKAFDLNIEQVLSLGVPRLDNLINNKYKYAKNNKKINILYAPTFRTDFNGKRYLIDLPNIKSLTAFFNNCNFALRVHPSIKISTNISGWENWTQLSQYESLIKADILITDYSSIFFDFLALNRPIIFYVPDYENYLKNERNLYFSPFKEFPFTTCSTEIDLIKCIDKVLINKNCKYNAFWKKYMESCDGMSSKKLASFICSLI